MNCFWLNALYTSNICNISYIYVFLVYFGRRSNFIIILIFDLDLNFQVIVQVSQNITNDHMSQQRTVHRYNNISMTWIMKVKQDITWSIPSKPKNSNVFRGKIERRKKEMNICDIFCLWRRLCPHINNVRGNSWVDMNSV